MREALTALARIAEMDDSARELDAELTELPARVGSLRQSLLTLEALIARESAALAEAEGIRAGRADDLKLRVDALARARAKTGHATNMRELSMAEREVEAARGTLKSREEELASLTASLTEKQAKLAEREAQLEEARGLCEAEASAAEARIGELRALREKAVEGRDALAAQVPPATLRRYEKVRERFKTGVSFVDSELCRACNRTLPAQLYTKVMRHEDFIDCPFCHRFVIHASLRD